MIAWLCCRVTRLGNIWAVGLLSEACCDFLKRWISPKKWQYFGLLFAYPNSLHFHLNKKFQTWCVIGILRFQKWFDVHDFGLSNWALMSIFWVGNCFGYFSQNLATFHKLWLLFTKFGFFTSSGHPVTLTSCRHCPLADFNLIIFFQAGPSSWTSANFFLTTRSWILELEMGCHFPLGTWDLSMGPIS